MKFLINYKDIFTDWNQIIFMFELVFQYGNEFGVLWITHSMSL